MYLQSKSDTFFPSRRRWKEEKENIWIEHTSQESIILDECKKCSLSQNSTICVCLEKLCKRKESLSSTSLLSLSIPFSLWYFVLPLYLIRLSLPTLPVTDWKCYFFQINSLQVTVESSDYKFKEGERVQNKTFSFFFLSSYFSLPISFSFFFLPFPIHLFSRLQNFKSPFSFFTSIDWMREQTV